ncbi:ABC-2 type transport system permease protein [Kitasatospora sp. MAP12-15]|uniref:ABC transporter permease subunit n=1 Tax=unclassified Kitasatospora TaxID=2633591 RepID=UPI0024771BD9|nr:ABC transporter permease [Kitasatospora sp. MAP12-44]MDH6114751.1 ABC-2 type transport system permease protein [Kitasatospora sp. MAP12-44]
MNPAVRPARTVRTGPRLLAAAGAEWIKFRSLRSVPAVLLATAVVLLLGAGLVSAGYRSGWSTMTAGDRAAFDPTYTSLRGIEPAQLLVGGLGVLAVTGEYACGLIRTTFAATPQRGQVLAAKALVLGAVVWGLSTAACFAAFLLGQSLLASPARHAGLGDPGVSRAVAGGGLYLLLVGLLGLALGALVRRTAAALAALFGVLLVLPLVVGMLPGGAADRIAPYLPAAAGSQLWTVVRGAGHAPGPWQGAGVFVLYVAGTAAMALVAVRRRDV